MDNMEKVIQRINELAAIKRERELTPDELQERSELRAIYIKGFRSSLIGQLENIRLVDEKGNKTPLKKKAEHDN